MIRALTLITLVLALSTCLIAQTKTDSLFPNPDEIKNDKPTLESAIAQFEDIAKDSQDGHMRSVNSNGSYNEIRTTELQKQLMEKRKYLASIPDTVSRQFEALMQQFAGSDQQTKNRMADDLHKRWKAKEGQVQQEIKELEEQLGVSAGRLSDLAVERQMLQISGALEGSEEALRQKQATESVNPNAESPAFAGFRELTVRRTLSQIQGLCPIHVKNLESELTIEYLDK